MPRNPRCQEDARIDNLVAALKVLAEPSRFHIVCYLSDKEGCVREIESVLGISQQLTSHHVNVLKDAGFLKLRKEGSWYYYSTDREFLDGLIQVFSEYLGD